jgi:nitrite reductase/ring-hydroxylating ferredoxin subunit
MSHPAANSTPLTPAEISRRKWLRAVIGAIAASISSIMAFVVGGAVLTPAFDRRGQRWVPAGRLRDLPAGVPTPVTVRVTRQDGYREAVEQQVVFLIKSDSGDVRALSSTCTHLGCRVSYDAATKRLRCPCHGGVFTPDGQVVGGPPPRPLPAVAARVDDSRVLVQL